MQKFRGWLTPPAFPGNDKKSRDAALLHTILHILLLVTILYLITAPIFRKDYGRYLLIGSLLSILWIVGIALVRRGHVRKTAVFYTSVTWVVFTFLAVLGGGNSSPIVPAYLLVIAIAGMVIGSQAGIIFATLSILATLGMALVEVYYRLPTEQLLSTPGSVWFILAVNFVSLAALLYMINRSLQGAFGRVERELSERMQAEQALRERSATLSALLDALPDAIFRVSPEGIWVDYIPSKEMETILPPEQFLGKSLEDVLPPDLAKSTRGYLEKTLARSQPQTFEYTLGNDQFEARMTPDDTGNVVIIVRNITARVQAQAEREQLLTALRRGNAQLHTSAEVSKSCTAIFDPKGLMEKAVNLIKNGLDVSYVGLFIVDPAAQNAVLQAGSGKAGQLMLEAGYYLPLNGQSMIAWSINHDRARIAQQTTRDKVWLQNPYLPNTRSELALPLSSRDQVIGALTVQSIVENAFAESDITVLQSMAEQLATTIDNANLFTELQRELAERNKAEAALRASEEKFQKIFETSPVAISIRDLKGRYLTVNNGFTKLTGYTQADVTGLSVEEVGFIKNWADWKRAYKKLSANRPVTDLLAEVQRKDGQIIYAVINSELTTLNGEARVLTTAIDITERKKSEEALRASEEKFSKAFHALSSAAFIQRAADHKYLEVNDAFCSLTGFGRQEVLDNTAQTLNVFGLHNDPPSIMNKFMDTGMVRNQEFTFMNKSGESGTGLLSIDQITVNQEPCFLILIRDISEQKKATLERDTLIQELSAKNAELERFTYTVSHDLKSPLVTIRGFAGYLEQDMLLGDIERLREDVKRITGAAEKMQRLLDELLELSRIGRLVNPPELVPFEEIAREAVSLVEGRLNKIHAEVRIEPDMPKVYVDRVRLVEVVQNLLDNAAKFMGDQLFPTIEIGSYPTREGETVFFVRDNGVGITKDYQERVFRLFDKLDSHTEGTGVGLALVKRIIEIHGGKIWVESGGARQGSTFLFTLLLKPKSSSSADD